MITHFSHEDIARLDTLLLNSPLGLVAWSDDGRVSFWSSNAQRIFGWTQADVVGKSLTEMRFVFDEDLPMVLALERATHDGSRKTNTGINRNYRNDGTVITCKWFNALRQDDPTCKVVSLVEDVTESYAANAGVRESEERFRCLFEYNPDLVVILDLDGRVLETNRAISNFVGLTPDAIRGSYFSTLLFPEDVPAHRHYLARARSGETIFYEGRMRGIGDASFAIRVTTMPIYQGGNVDRIFSIIRNETEQKVAAQALEESEQRLRSLFEQNPNGVIALDREGLVRSINNPAVSILGMDPTHILGRSAFTFVALADEPLARLRFAEALDGMPSTMLLHTSNPLGREYELDVTLIPQSLADHVTGVYVVLQDVTEKRQAERQALAQTHRIRDLYTIAATTEYSPHHLQETLATGARAFDAVVGAIIRTSEEETILETSFAAGHGMLECGEQIFRTARRVMEVRATGAPVHDETTIATGIVINGELYGALVFARVQPFAKQPEQTDLDLLALMATLIGTLIERGRARENLRALAYYDTLTGLPNRVALHEALRDSIESAQRRLSRVAVLFIDLDRFKDVNDTLGHALGDRLLELVAGRLVSEIGTRGTVARMGGDEFVVLLPNVRDAESVRAIASRLVTILSEPFDIDEYEQFASASIGVAIYPDDGRDDQALVKNADIAMYRAKDRGRNGFFFYNPALEAPIHLRLSQEKLLRRALERGQFSVHYQPQIDMRSGDIVGVEALVRWEDPKTGLIEPKHFIPSAEMSGLIVPLGEWVLATAATQIAEWQMRLGPLRFAVNLSGRQFHQRNIVERVLACCETTRIDPRFLELEITESVAMSDADHTVTTLRDLKSSGIRVSVDDFGTGYSSLAYLRRFALDAIKIDRSFIEGVGSGGPNEMIVTTLIAMAHNLKLEVVAEGVEDRKQLHWLQGQECDMAQGYFFAPALPSSEFERFFLQRRERSGSLS